jgi:hypothetical protein
VLGLEFDLAGEVGEVDVVDGHVVFEGDALRHFLFLLSM